VQSDIRFSKQLFFIYVMDYIANEPTFFGGLSQMRLQQSANRAQCGAGGMRRCDTAGALATPARFTIAPTLLSADRCAA